jgi:hypothetical protein
VKAKERKKEKEKKCEQNGEKQANKKKQRVSKSSEYFLPRFLSHSHFWWEKKGEGKIRRVFFFLSFSLSVSFFNFDLPWWEKESR